MNVRTFVAADFSKISLGKFRIGRAPRIPTSFQGSDERVHRVERFNGYLNVYYRLGGEAMNRGRTYVINSHRQRPKLVSQNFGFAAKF